MDRIDISVEVGKIVWEQIQESKPSESSRDISIRVNSAIQMQRERYKDIGEIYNSDLTSEYIKVFCNMSKKAELTLKRAYEKYELSPRSLERIKKVARTIADLEHDDVINEMHIYEAISLNKGIWHLMEEKQ